MLKKVFTAWVGLATLVVGLGGCSSSTKSSGGAPTADGGPLGGSTPTCAAYCDAIMTNCTGASGADAHQQYTAKENCLAACKAFPVGAESDTSGNTLGCRVYHAKAAAGDPATHCPHAGPGGDGTCGSTCDGYCQLVALACTGTSKIYTDDKACHDRCAATTDDERFNIGIQDGNHVACLLYHAQEAPLAPEDHCVGDLTPADAGVSYGSVTCQ